MGMHVTDRSFAALLEDGLYSVPRFQRDYRWTTQAQQLFGDITTEAKREPERPMFLGMFVLHDHANRGTQARVDIIDGQQRMATLCLFMAASREALSPDDTERKRVDEFLLEGDEPRLQLSANANNTFCDLIRGKKAASKFASPAAGRVFAAYNFARRQLKDKMEPDEVRRWLRFARRKVECIVLKVSRIHEAYQVFTSLNNTGLHLGEMDLLKCHLMEVADERADDVAEKWDIVCDAFAEDDLLLGNFVRHLWVVNTGTRPYPTLPKISSEVRNGDNAVAFTALMRDLCEEYNEVSELFKGHAPVASSWCSAGERGSLTALAIALPPEEAGPLLLALRRHLHALSPELLSALVRWAVRGRVTAAFRHASSLKLGHLIFQDGPEAVSKCEELVNLPSDTDFIAAFQNLTVNPKLAGYLLGALEKGSLHGLEEVAISKLAVKRVTPDRAAGWSGFTKDNVRQYCDRLGNYILLNDSQKRGLRADYTFGRLCEVVQTSNLDLTRHVASVRSWGPNAIEVRQRELAERAATIW